MASPSRRTLVAVVLALLLGAHAAVVLFLHAQLEGLTEAQARGAKGLAEVVLTHTIPQPLHDNGVACVAGMADVLPPPREPFTRESALLTELRAGKLTWATLPEETAQGYARLQPWAATLRECASSAKLKLVDGLQPRDEASAPGKRVRVLRALDTWFTWQAVELHRMAADGAEAQLRLERCTSALALAADASFLGGGLEVTEFGLLQLTPLCGDALAAATPGERKVTGDAWAMLPARVAPLAHLVRWERYGDVGVEVTRAPPGERWHAGLLRGHQWARWDDAWAKLETAAAGEPEQRRAALDLAAPELKARAEPLFKRHERALGWLELLAATAKGDTSPRPHVTRENGVVRSAPPGDPVVEFKLPN